MVGGNRKIEIMQSSVRKSPYSKNLLRIVSTLSICCIIFGTVCFVGSKKNLASPLLSTTGITLFDDNGRYVMRNYDDIKPNSNFLAGLGGLWGVPMVRLVFAAVCRFVCHRIHLFVKKFQLQRRRLSCLLFKIDAFIQSSLRLSFRNFPRTFSSMIFHPIVGLLR